MDFFGIFWLGAVAFAAYWQAAWFVRAMKTGVATYYFHHEIKREEKPFEFRMLLLARLVSFCVAAAMFFFGLQFFEILSP